MSATQVNFQEADIEDIFKAWVSGYRIPQGGTLLKYESFYDPGKRRVVFKLFIELPQPENDKIITMNG